MKPWFKGGGGGWFVIGTLALAWDLAAPETLSAAFQRARGNRASGAVVVVAWALLTAHLFQLLPERADPFRGPVDAARKALQRGSSEGPAYGGNGNRGDESFCLPSPRSPAECGQAGSLAAPVISAADEAAQ
jgi:hypothetical protein